MNDAEDDGPLCAGEPDWRRDSHAEECWEPAEPGSDYCPTHNPDNR